MKKFYFLFLFALIASISNLYAAEKTVTYKFTSKTWEAAEGNWTSIVDAGQFVNGKGPAATTKETKPSAESPVEYTKIKSIKVSWATSKSGAGSIAVYVGDKIQSTVNCTKNKSNGEEIITPTDQDGKVKFVMTRTGGNVYLPSISITYEGGSETQCATPTFSVEGGTYSEAQTIALAPGEGGEKVFYTINGGTERQYIEPIVLNEDGAYEISAYTAATETLGKSATVTKTYVINFPLEVPYILCQNAAWLTEGTKIIFVGKNATTGGAFGMAAQNGTKYREQDIVTLSGDEKSLISKGDKVRVFTVEKSGNDIAFKDIEGYLSADNTKNSIQTKKTIGSDSYWTVSVAADGVATVASKTATTYKCIMYNAGNTPRFSAYKADFDGAVYIYLLGSTSSVSSMSAEGVKVFAAEGGVEVVAEEATDVAVYTAAGQLVRQARVAEGSTLVNVAPGFYVVRANGTATKVIVR